MALPLERLRVLDFTIFVPGQMSTLILAEMGADVIKIERSGIRESVYSITHGGKEPSPELMKKWMAANTLDRSKRSLTINLKSDAGREIFYRLARKSDVVIEGNRPGIMKRLGIDYNTVKEMNPRIIYCALTGYGQDGPYSLFPARDLTCIGISGILGIINEGGLPPIVPGVKIADLAGAMYATIGILLALAAREKTGRGQFVDIAMMDGAISWLTAPLIRYFEDGQVQPNKGEIFLSGKRPGYNIYRAKDGKYFCIAIREPWFWEKLCQKLGRGDLIPYQNPDNAKLNEIISEFSNIFLTKERAEWLEELEDIGVTKVSQFDDLVSDPQAFHRNMFVEVNTPGVGPFKQIGCPIKLSETPSRIKGPAPAFGQDTESILKKLGYSQEEIKEFYESKTVE
jgi:crotonobetainyl-CoA:carnitine CoA-transferase CaiB-like acyl-CoA transferase